MNTPWEQRPWVDSYRLALIETNAAMMPARIEAAKAAVKSRIDELGRSVDGAAERAVLMDAMNALRFLTQEGTLLKEAASQSRLWNCKFPETGKASILFRHNPSFRPLVIGYSWIPSKRDGCQKLGQPTRIAPPNDTG